MVDLDKNQIQKTGTFVNRKVGFVILCFLVVGIIITGYLAVKNKKSIVGRWRTTVVIENLPDITMDIIFDK